MMKELLLAAIENTADWRMQNTGEYPGDARNKHSAIGLHRMLEVIGSLPEDHPLFHKLALANELNGEGWSELEGQFISQWDFHNGELGSDAGVRFLTELRDLANKFITDHGITPL